MPEDANVADDPADVADSEEVPAPVNGPAQFPHYLKITQFVVRMVGVFFAVEGLTGVIGNGVDIVFQWWRLRQDEYIAWATDGEAFAWFVASVAQLCIGAYLAFSGRWVIEKVFFPPSSKDEQSHDQEAAEPDRGR